MFGTEAGLTQHYGPSALIVAAAAAGLLFWFKHPAAWELTLLIGWLVWAGFHMQDVVPGLREYEAGQEREGAYSSDLCYESEDSLGNPTEVCPTRPSTYLGIPILGMAIYLATKGGARAQVEG